ncbi:MAG: GTP cyclohydrolase, FolE2/MptA family [Desulfurococcales archaeon]|nr:GTP cyclohydrolase, FolE2/MptA family [Desulfurococcales archaeon]
MEVEIQDMPPKHPYPLDLVGVKGVKYLVRIRSPRGIIEFPVTYNAYVKLSPGRRAVHLSRNIEAFIEALVESEKKGKESLEALMEEVAVKLLGKHEYTEYARAELELEHFVETGRTLEPVNVRISIEAWRNNGKRWTLTLGVTGITACPHAQVNISKKLNTPVNVTPTHMQRARIEASISFTEKRVYNIEGIALKLLKAFSQPTRTLLKKDDEARLIIEAHRNPKLVEDVARDALSILEEVIEPPAEICVKATSYESIHPYNVFAERCMVLNKQ